jgi:hypothetical protein
MILLAYTCPPAKDTLLMMVMMVCSFMVKGPGLNHRGPGIFASPRPRGKESSWHTMEVMMMEGFLMEKRMFSPDPMVTKSIPRNHTRKVLHGVPSSSSLAETDAATSGYGDTSSLCSIPFSGLYSEALIGSSALGSHDATEGLSPLRPSWSPGLSSTSPYPIGPYMFLVYFM